MALQNYLRASPSKWSSRPSCHSEVEGTKHRAIARDENHIKPSSYLAGLPILESFKTWVCLKITGWWFSHPSKKYDFVNWDDDSNPIYGKIKKMATKPPTR